MKILGIADGMNSGAALLEDGRPVYAVNEERLIRAKMASGFPRESICRVLSDTHTDPTEVDGVAVAMVNDFFRKKAVAYDGWFRRDQPRIKEVLLSASSHFSQVLGSRPFLQESYYQMKFHLGKARRRAIKELLRRDWSFTCPIEFVDHHWAHACSAYYTAGLDDATVITMDGAGDNCSSHVYRVQNGQFRKLWSVDSFNSLGNYYGYITHICGFKAHKHEGKITGLAAYGTPLYVDLLRQFITYEAGSTVNRGEVFYWAAIKAIQKALPANYKKENLAASIQKVLEDVGSEYIRHWVETSGCADLALAGGVFANVKFNQRIRQLDGVRSLFVHPAMGDEGLALGAAFAAAAKRINVRSSALANAYLGPEYCEHDIEKALDGAGLPAQYIGNVEQKIAEILARGGIVARFDGRMEYGPRALGNRSILCQATDPTVNNWLNKRLQRTEFMPFAPVTLEEFADECYVGLEGCRHAAQFMTITVNCTEWMKQHCPAVVHIDGTARPQLIAQRTNPGYYRILDEYRKITGLPTLINTSFNMHEEPIVCSPSDALRSFTEGALDYLALGNYLVPNPRSVERAEAR
jgi:carbamoyltransferase